MIEVLLFFLILLLVALFSRRIDNLPLSPQLIFILAGIITGWLFTGNLDVKQAPLSTTILLIAEVALVLLLFTEASQVKIGDLKTNHLPRRLLSIGFIYTMVLGISLAALIFSNLSFWEAAIIGVVLTPTDASLGEVILKNNKIPDKIREALEVESGLKDGFSVPFLLVFISVGLAEEFFSSATYFVEIALAQVGLGILVGILVGYMVSKLVIKSKSRGWITPEYQRLAYLALALLCFLLAHEIGGSGFVAAFVGGLTTAYVTRDAGKALLDFAEAEGQFLNLTVFYILGIIIAGLIPSITWEIILYAFLSLTVIRMLPVILSLMGSEVNWHSALFIGWFGPRGLASIVLTLIALETVDVFPGQDTFILAVFITVFFSVVAHGITAVPLSRLYLEKIQGKP